MSKTALFKKMYVKKFKTKILTYKGEDPDYIISLLETINAETNSAETASENQ